MAVTIVGTPLAINDGTSYTAEAGSDRVVVVAIGVEEFISVTFAPTFGGQAFTQGVFIEGTDRSYAYIGYIKEADIPVGSNAFALNPSTAVDETDGTIFTLSGVDQTTVGAGATLDSPAAVTRTLNLTGVADGAAVAVFDHEATGVITADPNWTTHNLGSGTNHKNYTASKTTTAGADTFEPTTGSAVDGVLAGFVLNAAPSYTITSIDGDNDVQAGQTVSFVGTGLTPPFVSATLGGKTVTLAGNESATGGDVTIPLHIDVEWGSTTNDFVLTDQVGPVTLSNVTLSAPTGWETASFSTIPDTATTESFYEYSQTDATVGNFTAQVGDTLAFTSSTGLTIDGSSIPVVNPAATVTGSYKWWDASLSTWTPVSSYTITNLGVFGGSDTTVMIQEMISEMISEMVN